MYSQMIQIISEFSAKPEFFLKLCLISYRSPINANMIARPTLGVGIGLILISFFATSNAGMLSEIQQKLNQNTNIFKKYRIIL